MPRWRNRILPDGLVPAWPGSTVGHVVDASTGCWMWTGSVNPKTGYGLAHKWGKEGTRLAHRVIYERARGPIAAGLQLDHLCRHRSCVNPDHLEPVPAYLNIWRGLQSKLTPEQVIEIRRRHAAGGVKQKDLALEFGVSKVAIHNIVRRLYWRALEASV
jgi:hypothetical protein